MASHRLLIENFAQIQKVDLEFGDLTVLVGAQGTGKSLALQWLKFAIDEEEVRIALRDAGFEIKTSEDAADAYFGEGMRGALQEGTEVLFDEIRIRLDSLTRPSAKIIQRTVPEMFFIPAHRALLLADGWPSPFMKLGLDTPVVARLFSQLLFERLSRRQETTLFPRDGRVADQEMSDRIDKTVFHGGRMSLETRGLRRRLELKYGEGAGLPFMTWTAGQREFAPLLLGLYHLQLLGALPIKLNALNWVVIEEPEMGLHPQAIATVMLLVIDLLRRGYRVVISTHSPLVLDFVWALRQFKQPSASVSDLARALNLNSPQAAKMLKAAISKDLRVHYLVHDAKNRVTSQDISELDPGSESEAESTWGGLTQFGTSLGEAVGRIPEEDT